MSYLSKIEEYKPYDVQEQGDKEQISVYAKVFEDLLTRNNTIVHFTSTGFVVNKSRDKVLMVYHNIYKSWAWTGGHADGDSNFLEVAIREVKEETGIKNVTLVLDDIFSLEILPVFGHIKKGKYVAPHQHVNITFLLEADENEVLHSKEDENSGVKWIPIDEIEEYSTECHMYPVYNKIVEKMKKL